MTEEDNGRKISDGLVQVLAELEEVTKSLERISLRVLVILAVNEPSNQAKGVCRHDRP